MNGSNLRSWDTPDKPVCNTALEDIALFVVHILYNFIATTTYILYDFMTMTTEVLKSLLIKKRDLSVCLSGLSVCLSGYTFRHALTSHADNLDIGRGHIFRKHKA